MKEITRISLASLPYNSEVAAKKELEKYLQAVETALDADNEAMKEIEARIAELLADHGVTGEKVISLADVEMVKLQLGSPKDFADQSATAGVEEAANPEITERRLLRDTHDQVIGGVCAGLAAYLRVDAAWIRLGSVLLAIVTSGAMIPIYLIMWLVLPPARTAAERLQMKGAPVTLEAIQKESTLLAGRQERNTTVLTVFRIMTGIGALLVGAAACVGLAVVLYAANASPESLHFSNREWFYFWWLAAAGVLFVVFCSIVARALFVNRYTKLFWASLCVIAVLGISAFSAGALGFRALRNHDIYGKQWVSSSIDSTSLAATKRLEIQTDIPLTLKYTVDSTRTSAQIHYSKHGIETRPTVRFVQSGETLTVSLKGKTSACTSRDEPCSQYVALELFGPALEAIASSHGNDVTYRATAQQSLAVTAQRNSSMTVESDGSIENVTAHIAKSATADFLRASIPKLALTIEGERSAALVANVTSLNLTIPTACGVSDETQARVDIAHAESITVNGVPYQNDTKYPCAEIHFSPKDLR
ncbi:hypothetical protein CSA80_02645 [Candidatus Saccharibacteria bacterium]|nr:MAG: hypothetical protein CR973_02760 [Candidatus Saccharibacteria bacterium]PID98995.1 MAG: hypothetical protein CSA80_02645 [Candidatus Saccharibacteria bacterium]